MPIHLILAGGVLLALASAAQAQNLREGRSFSAQHAFVAAPARGATWSDAERYSRPDDGFGSFSTRQTVRTLGY